MPIYKTIIQNTKTVIYIWKIEETFEVLFNNIELNEKSLSRLGGMKSELHQKGFLSVRYLLKEAGYTDFDLHYNKYGKPLLKDGKHISISHSYQFSTIIVSNFEVGIDIEKIRDKIFRIKDRFVNTAIDSLSNEDMVKQLTVIWGAKEAMYKTYPYGGLSFHNNIAIDPFLFVNSKSTGRVIFNSWEKEYDIYFMFLEEGFTLVYAIPKLKKEKIN